MAAQAQLLRTLASAIESAKNELNLARMQSTTAEHLHIHTQRAAIQAARAVAAAVDAGFSDVWPSGEWILGALRNPDDPNRPPAILKIGNVEVAMTQQRFGSGCNADGSLRDDTAIAIWVQQITAFNRPKAAKGGAAILAGPYVKTDSKGQIVGRDGQPLDVVYDFDPKSGSHNGCHVNGEPARNFDNFSENDWLAYFRCLAADWIDVCDVLLERFYERIEVIAGDNGNLERLLMLVTKAKQVFDTAGVLGRAFKTEHQANGPVLVSDPKSWDRYRERFGVWSQSILALKDVIQLPPPGFSEIAVSLTRSAKIAKEIRDVMATDEGKSFSEFLRFWPELNTNWRDGSNAIAEFEKANRPADPYEFLSAPTRTNDASIVDPALVARQIRNEQLTAEWNRIEVSYAENCKKAGIEPYGNFSVDDPTYETRTAIFDRYRTDLAMVSQQLRENNPEVPVVPGWQWERPKAEITTPSSLADYLRDHLNLLRVTQGSQGPLVDALVVGAAHAYDNAFRWLDANKVFQGRPRWERAPTTVAEAERMLSDMIAWLDEIGSPADDERNTTASRTVAMNCAFMILEAANYLSEAVKASSKRCQVWKETSDAEKAEPSYSEVYFSETWKDCHTVVRQILLMEAYRKHLDEACANTGLLRMFSAVSQPIKFDGRYCASALELALISPKRIWEQVCVDIGVASRRLESYESPTESEFQSLVEKWPILSKRLVERLAISGVDWALAIVQLRQTSDKLSLQQLGTASPVLSIVRNDRSESRAVETTPANSPLEPTETGTSDLVATKPAPPEPDYVFRCEGVVYFLSAFGQSGRVPNGVGIRILKRFVEATGRALPLKTLVLDDGAQMLRADDTLGLGGAATSPQPVYDTEYLEKLRIERDELVVERDKFQDMHDYASLAIAQKELDEFDQRVKADLRIGNRPRDLNDDTGNLRSNMHGALKTVYKQMRHQDVGLAKIADHFKRFIRPKGQGTYAYDPDPYITWADASQDVTRETTK